MITGYGVDRNGHSPSGDQMTTFTIYTDREYATFYIVNDVLSEATPSSFKELLELESESFMRDYDELQRKEEIVSLFKLLAHLERLCV